VGHLFFHETPEDSDAAVVGFLRRCGQRSVNGWGNG